MLWRSVHRKSFVLVWGHEDGTSGVTVMCPRSGEVRVVSAEWLVTEYEPSDDFSAARRYVNAD